MTRLTRIVAGVWFALASVAQAEGPVVVELFTSQGCSSCPPADAIFRELAEREDVIALSLHVDYWDYIGWKDEFADPSHAARQREYARVAGRRSIYTPQMIVNGETDIVGTKPMKLAKAIADHAAKPKGALVMLDRAGSALEITLTPGSVTGPFSVYLVRYTPLREARITRGENAGHTLKYANVAQDWQMLTEWEGRATVTLDAAVQGDMPAVVLVQHRTSRAIVSAARVR